MGWLDANEYGGGWLALELNDFGNAPRAQALRLACEETNGRVRFGIWLTRNFTAAEARQSADTTGASFFIAEGEIPAQIREGELVRPNPQAQNWSELVHEFSDLAIDKAVATSWSPFQKWEKVDGEWRLLPAPEFARALIRAGWYVLPYVYPSETPTHSVAGAKVYCRHYTHESAPTVLAPGEGWYRPEPVAGVYAGPHGDFNIGDAPFEGIEECAGFSIWDAGEEF